MVTLKSAGTHRYPPTSPMACVGDATRRSRTDGAVVPQLDMDIAGIRHANQHATQLFHVKQLGCECGYRFDSLVGLRTNREAAFLIHGTELLQIFLRCINVMMDG